MNWIILIGWFVILWLSYKGAVYFLKRSGLY